MKRLNLILALVLAAQVVLSAVVFWPRSAATGSEALFPGLQAGDVVALTVTDDQGNAIALRKVEGAWAMPEADNYPAQENKITPLLEKIAKLNSGRLVTRTDASHKRLKVAAGDFLRRIDFETADGTRHTLYLGSSPSYGVSHFRLEGQHETYLTNEFSGGDANATAADWLDTAYFNVAQDDLTRVTLENANGTFVFTRDDAGNWTLAGLKAGEQLAAGTVTGLIGKAASVTLLKPLGTKEDAAYGLDEPLATVTLEKKDGQSVTLLVGAQDPADKSYVVKVSTSPYYVRVAEYGVNTLVADRREDFIQPPSTPTPVGTPGAP
jgi:hypothetical protein